MRLLCALVVVLFNLAILAGGYVVAQESPLNIRYTEAKGTRISGSTDPASVPKHIKYHMFISNYQRLFGPTIVQDVSQEDDAVLSDASSSFGAFQAENHRIIEADLVHLCSRRGSLDLTAIATEVDRIYASSDIRRENYFDRVIARLSEAGQSTVANFVDRQVASGIDTVIPQSQLESVKEDPSEFEYWLDNECHRVLTGGYPAELQERMEKFREKLAEDDSILIKKGE